jgi:hypothetical protein
MGRALSHRVKLRPGDTLLGFQLARLRCGRQESIRAMRRNSDTLSLRTGLPHAAISVSKSPQHQTQERLRPLLFQTFQRATHRQSSRTPHPNTRIIKESV